MVPVVDLSSSNASAELDRACRDVGFFLLTGHGLDPALKAELDRQTRALFALPDAEKQAVAMSHSGRAWRGWFPLEGELTSGVPDLKEGFYVGRDLPADHPSVRAGRPLHGANVWPAGLSGLRPAVEAWMTAVEDLGQRVLSALGEGLGIGADGFRRSLTADPVVLFRMFRYPPHPPGPAGEGRWGVGEHSDYGLLTLLAHDGRPGLEVKLADGSWLPVPADPDLFVCNLGDMLDRLTGGRYRSTPHRVRRHTDDGDRLSFPFFLDPDWQATIDPLVLDDGWTTPTERLERWDRANLGRISGSYGDWLTTKVAKVFPDLAAGALG